jgi:hypothetical protein
MRKQLWIVMFAAILGLAARARAADDTTAQEDKQYAALSDSRTRAELATRRARSFFLDNDNAWKQASLAVESARQSADDFLVHAMEAEQRKPDDQRNQAASDKMAQKRSDIDQDWRKFANVTRPDLEKAYRDGYTTSMNTAEVFHGLTSIESAWKDAKGDLAPLAAMYDDVAKKADEARANGERSLAGIVDAQKAWEGVHQATTRKAE